MSAKSQAGEWLQGNRWNVMASKIPPGRLVGGALQNDHPLAVAGRRASDNLDKH